MRREGRAFGLIAASESKRPATEAAVSRDPALPVSQE